MNVLRRNYLRLLKTAVLLAALLIGCATPQGNDAPTAGAPVAEAAATPALPQSVPDESTADSSQPSPPPATAAADVAGVEQYGVSFQVDPSLAAAAQARIGDAVTDYDTSYALLPQHLLFTFADSYAEREPFTRRHELNWLPLPQIIVYPADAYAALQEGVGPQIAQLQTLLAERPPAPGGTLPFLPLLNAAQVLHSGLAYLDFANGAGVRYVTTFSQAASPITSQDLLYTFQGLTDDGRYYVTAVFPVTTTHLPDSLEVDDWDAFSAEFPTYLGQTKATLDELSAADFTPDLTLLDALMSSLRVKPDVTPAGGETAVSTPAQAP
jgi:hypothetical protein